MVIYFSVAFFWRSYLIWKRTGINPYTLGKSESAHDFVGQVFRLTAAASIVVVVLYAFSGSWYYYLGPIAWLQHPVITFVGLGLLLLSLLWIVVAQIQMGNAWRIGIDQHNQTQLIQGGLFKVSRNPIFLGMRVNLLGFFLVLPNAITLTIFVLGDVLMQIQVRLEEEYLTQVHGESYRTYRDRTRRWI
jgi:protein-S-isoprenylcysteine O-methyltransferase Ste14